MADNIFGKLSNRFRFLRETWYERMEELKSKDRYKEASQIEQCIEELDEQIRP